MSFQQLFKHSALVRIFFTILQYNQFKTMKFYHKKFKELRTKNRWTQVALAKECGITRHTIALWEKGSYTPTETMARKLASILNINVSEISNLKPELQISGKSLETPLSSLLELTDSTAKERYGIRDNIIEQVISQHNKLEQILAILKIL